MDELRRIDLNLLVTLHALLVEKHVARASVRLHKSQPAVSHSLALLRAHFDDPLLIRRHGRMALTARAQALALLAAWNGKTAPASNAMPSGITVSAKVFANIASPSIKVVDCDAVMIRNQCVEWKLQICTLVIHLMDD